MNKEILFPKPKLNSIKDKYTLSNPELNLNNFNNSIIYFTENDNSNLIKKIQAQFEGLVKEFIYLIDNTPEIILATSFESDFKKIIFIIDMYDLEAYKSLIYEKIGDIYKVNYDYNKAYSFYIAALENYTNLFNSLDLIKLIIKIDYCCGRLGKYAESIEFLNLAKLYMPEPPLEEGFKIKYNLAISYKKLGDFDIALKHISNIEILYSEILKTNLVRCVNLNILKANCYTELKSYNLALKIHRETLVLTKNNVELHILTLMNILEIYLNLSDRKNIKDTLDECVFLIKDYDKFPIKKYAPDFYYDISEGFYHLEDYTKSKIYLNRSILESKKYKNTIIMEKALNVLIKIAIKENDHEEIVALKNQLLEMLSLKIIEPTNPSIFEFISYYNSIFDSNTVDEIVTFMQNFLVKSSEE